jgi:hypothetical protein
MAMSVLKQSCVILKYVFTRTLLTREQLYQIKYKISLWKLPALLSTFCQAFGHVATFNLLLLPKISLLHMLVSIITSGILVLCSAYTLLAVSSLILQLMCRIKKTVSEFISSQFSGR